MVGRAICLQVGNWFETRFSPPHHLIHHNSEDTEDGGVGGWKDLMLFQNKEKNTCKMMR